MRIITSTSNSVGGTMADQGNVISGNAGDGIHIAGGTSTGATIWSNLIGVGADGTTPLGNGAVGISTASPDAVIGVTAGTGNTIAYNSRGIVVAGAVSIGGVQIARNSIFSNTVLGIDLDGDGVTANDAGDSDTGTANNLQNFPVLASATWNAGSVTITGSINTNANALITVHFYRSTACSSSTFGEGQTWIGSTTFLTDGSGNGPINIVVSGAATGVITATALNADTGDSSEFSQCVSVVDPSEGTPQFSRATYNTNEGAGFVTITVTRVGGSSGPASVQYQTQPGTAFPLFDFTTTTGTLNWADGDSAPKTFNVPIVDDPDVEGAETFQVVIQDATGATLGTPNIATVTIAASDAEIPAVPAASEWALIALAAMLAIGGAIVMRRA